MHSSVAALRTASVLFGLAAVAHLVRILAAITVSIGGIPIGRRWSVVAVIVLAALCAWFWRASCPTEKKAETEAPGTTPHPVA